MNNNPSFLPTTFGVLRPWHIDDALALVKYANNRKIWLNLRDGFPYPYTTQDAQHFLDMVSRQTPQTFFAIATHTEAIGGIGIMPNSDVHRLTAELGYWLAEPFWGKGIMSEAVYVFTEFAFAQFNLVRIYAEPYAYNNASSRVLEKAGFSFEGRLKCSVIKDGVILDQLLYAKINPGINSASS